LILLSVRRRTPPRQMMELLREHLKAGKPLVGIRTASHAFGAKPGDEQHESWVDFDQQILGCRYEGHYDNGRPGKPLTSVRPASDTSRHPILTGMPAEEFRVTTSLYKYRDAAKTVTPLLMGQVEGQSDLQPVAWVNTAEGRRVFYTSLGGVEDFQQPCFRRLLLNGILWSLDMPIGQ
jgi:type 1 glutamine amidotransferase